MDTTERLAERRVSIWSVSPAMLGVYFVIFWVQCVAGIATDAYYQVQQRSDAPVFVTLLEVIRGAGPTGIGAAVNAIVIALFVEAIMVLAQIIKRRQLEQGRAIGLEQGRAQGVEQGREQGLEQGAEQARLEHTEQLRAWAKERGIPLDELPEFGKPTNSSID